MNCVYKITNLLNNKIYIGKTSDYKKRWYKHIYTSKKDIKKSLIHKAIKKYGIDNFKFEILEENLIQDELTNREIYYISLYKTNVKKYGNKYGYNLTDGGEGISGYKYTTKQKEKINTAKLSKKQVLEILEAYNCGAKVSDIKQTYNVSKSTVNRIIRGKCWSELNKHPIKRKPGAKLTESKIIDIYNYFINNNVSIFETSKKFNVSKFLIWDMLSGRTWKNLNLDTNLSKKLIIDRDIMMRKNKYKGSGAPSNKLTEEDVLKIRKLWPIVKNKTILSKQFNVSRRTIKLIVENKTWQDI